MMKDQQEQKNTQPDVIGQSQTVNTDVPMHTRGESIFLDDIPVPRGVVYAAVLMSPVAHGEIKKLEIADAAQSPGVVAIYTAQDIPGENQVGGIIQDEALLADGHTLFIGEPLALVIAETKTLAKKTFSKIKVEIDPLPVITDPREAFKQGRLIIPPRTFFLGDIALAWKECDVIVEGEVESGGQEHFYMETQGALAIPLENSAIKVYSSTQSPTTVQRAVARVLGLAMHEVEIETRRLGGGFGGKEDQATAWAALAALAAFKLKRPVKLVLDRREDMIMTGKRHPYSSDFKIGLKSDGTILAYEVMFYQNSGAAADLSTAILERTLFHTTNSYFIPNVKATAACCYTHVAPFTAFRGFGGPQAMFVIESAIHKAAKKMNLQPRVIQQKNLLKENDPFPYGMPAKNCHTQRCWNEADQRYHFEKVYQEANTFNSSHALIKKGVAIMPICFGISFTNTALNQAGALVHVYTDGSVSVSTGAVEMGQGVNMKILGIVARTFSISPQRVKVESTNTSRVANTSPTAASCGTDLNGKAAQVACENILDRLKILAASQLQYPEPGHIAIKDETVYLDHQPTSITWEKLVHDAYWQRINLSAQGFYATPHIHFDREKEKGHPFAYHAYGTAIIQVTVDGLRGIYTVDAVRVVHDAGKSLNYLIDRGQVEGALLQGIGWMTMEELLYSPKGELLTANTSTYKIPDIKSTPSGVDIYFLEESNNPGTVFSSKAIGEPPFMYGIGTYFAIQNALEAFRPGKELFYHSPLTPRKVFMFLYPGEA